MFWRLWMQNVFRTCDSLCGSAPCARASAPDTTGRCGHGGADRLPTVNSLIQRINIRKRRDALILGAVISGCTVLMLWYALA